MKTLKTQNIKPITLTILNIAIFMYIVFRFARQEFLFSFDFMEIFCLFLFAVPYLYNVLIMYCLNTKKDFSIKYVFLVLLCPISMIFTVSALLLSSLGN